MKPPLRNSPEASNQKSLRLQQIAGKAARYTALSEQIKPLEKEKKSLSGDLKEAVSMYGAHEKDQDGNPTGSAKLELPGYTVAVITPKSEQVDHAIAVQELERLGLLERCTVRTLNEEALKIAFQEGLLDIDTINKFTKTVEGSPRISVSVS
jgi:hypothetical protein